MLIFKILNLLNFFFYIYSLLVYPNLLFHLQLIFSYINHLYLPLFEMAYLLSLSILSTYLLFLF